MRYVLPFLSFSLAFIIGVSSASIARFFITDNSPQLASASELTPALDPPENKGLHFTEEMRACKGYTADGGILGYSVSYQGSDGTGATAGSYWYSVLGKARQRLSKEAKEGIVIERKLSRKRRAEVECLTVELADHTISAYQRDGKLIQWIWAQSVGHVDIVKRIEGWKLCR